MLQTKKRTTLLDFCFRLCKNMYFTLLPKYCSVTKYIYNFSRHVAITIIKTSLHKWRSCLLKNYRNRFCTSLRSICSASYHNTSSLFPAAIMRPHWNMRLRAVALRLHYEFTVDVTKHADGNKFLWKILRLEHSPEHFRCLYQFTKMHRLDSVLKWMSFSSVVLT